MMDILPFHKWKDTIVKKDAIRHPKSWYYVKYSEYVQKNRNPENWLTLPKKSV